MQYILAILKILQHQIFHPNISKQVNQEWEALLRKWHFEGYVVLTLSTFKNPLLTIFSRDKICFYITPKGEAYFDNISRRRENG